MVRTRVVVFLFALGSAIWAVVPLALAEDAWLVVGGLNRCLNRCQDRHSGSFCGTVEAGWRGEG